MSDDQDPSIKNDGSTSDESDRREPPSWIARSPFAPATTSKQIAKPVVPKQKQSTPTQTLAPKASPQTGFERPRSESEQAQAETDKAKTDKAKTDKAKTDKAKTALVPPKPAAGHPATWQAERERDKVDTRAPAPRVSTGTLDSKPKVQIDPSLLSPKPGDEPQPLSASSKSPPILATGPNVTPGGASVPPAPRSIASSDRGDPPRDRDDRDIPARPQRRFPLWAVVIAFLVVTVTALLVLDLHNQDRYRLRCDDGKVYAQQANRFPWPFGYETLGGALRPVTLVKTARCATQVFDSRTALEAGLLQLLMEHVERAMQDPTGHNLVAIRLHLQQSNQLAAKPAHAAQRKRLKALMADLSYRQGRERLATVETALREALSLLAEAQKLGGDRYEDLGDWILHLQGVIRSLSSTPGTVAHPPPAAPQVRRGGTTPTGTTPTGTTSARTRRGPPPAPLKVEPDAAPAPDAGVSDGPEQPQAGGILM